MKSKSKIVANFLNREELKLLRSLKTPQKIQDFLNSIPFNFEKGGETHNSVRYTLKSSKAHCFEGALVAALALWLGGEQPLILDLKTVRPDFDHVVALFKRDGMWGAISKTNHPVLRYRDPVYKSIRELVMSYFNEYYLESGKKTLRSYSKPLDLRKAKENWLTGEENLATLAHKLDQSPHITLLTPKQVKNLRKTDLQERQILKLEDFKS